MSASKLECGICSGSFEDPRLISCHHSFCYKCLEDLVRKTVKNGYFNCPVCRASVKLPWDGVSGFRRLNHNESDYGETFADNDFIENVACDICNPGMMAYSKCLNCEVNMCRSCCNVHGKLKPTRHHKISYLGTIDYKRKEKSGRRIVCKLHSEEEMRLFCQNCRELICIVCQASEHKSHATNLVHDAACEMKKILQTKVIECSHKLKRIAVSKQTVEELNKNINDAEKEEIKAVEDKHSQLMQLLSQDVAKVKDKINTVYHDLRQQNAVLEKDIQDEFKTCYDVMKDTRELADQGNDIEIMEKGPNLDKLISGVISSPDRTPNIRLTNKVFSPADFG